MPIYRDIYDGPPRWYTATETRKLYVMIHATANTASAENEAAFAKHRDTRASSHYYVDDDSIVQSLNTDYRAWHAGNDEGNDRAIAYELTARNMNVGRAWWVDLANIEWPLMVAAIARDCKHHGITPRDLTVAQLRAGSLTGFCMHFEGNQAWGGSDHTDPGPNFPMDHLVDQVKRAMEDDMDLRDTHTIPGWATKRWPELGDTVSVQTDLSGGYLYSKLAYEEHGARLAAIEAAVTGEDIGPAVRAELDRHRALMAATFGENLTEAVLAGLREQLSDVADERLAAAAEAGTRRALGSLDES